MRQFLKDHPWQLEIVPAAAFLTCIGAGVYCLTRQVDWEIRISFFYFCVWMASFGGAFWAFEASVNHKWVVAERQKSFNYMALAFQAIMLMWTWMAVELAAIGSAGSHIATSVPTPWPLLPILLALGLSVAVFLELRRSYTTTNAAIEPTPPDPAEQSSTTDYHESEDDWWMIVAGLAFLVAYAMAGLLTREWALLALGLLGGIFLASFTRRTVVVTSNAFSLRCGIVRRRVLVSEITECEAVHRHPFAARGLKGIGGLCNTTGRCLEIKTASGKTHTFGMLRPAYACRLIRSMIDASGTASGETL